MAQSTNGVHCWVAAADLEIRRQSYAARRVAPVYSPFPLDEKKTPIPRKLIKALCADIREGLEETFDRLGCCAPFIPGFTYKQDAIKRAQLLRDCGREGTDILYVQLTQCEPHIGRYRWLEHLAEDVQYLPVGLPYPKGDVRVICEPFTEANVVDRVSLL